MEHATFVLDVMRFGVLFFTSVVRHGLDADKAPVINLVLFAHLESVGHRPASGVHVEIDQPLFVQVTQLFSDRLAQLFPVLLCVEAGVSTDAVHEIRHLLRPQVMEVFQDELTNFTVCVHVSYAYLISRSWTGPTRHTFVSRRKPVNRDYLTFLKILVRRIAMIVVIARGHRLYY